MNSTKTYTPVAGLQERAQHKDQLKLNTLGKRSHNLETASITSLKTLHSSATQVTIVYRKLSFA